MLVKNTTIQNRTKFERLSKEHILPSHSIEDKRVVPFLQGLKALTYSKQTILYSLGVHLLGKTTNPAALKFLNEYKSEILIFENVPYSEFDLLGSAYQFLNTKMENLIQGSFYTNGEIAKDFVLDLDFNKGQTILDPSCGSGAFLFRSNAPATQIVGIDVDPIAIMIAKFNYFIKFPDAPSPKIYCEDFFTWYEKNKSNSFDYVIGNPPYGANIDLTNITSTCVTSGESFSYFIEFGFRLLKPKGVFRYLLPESVLNVKRHADIRTFILNEESLSRIKRYSKKFTGVMSDVYLLELNRKANTQIVFEDGESTSVPKNVYEKLNNRIFVNLNKLDIAILEKVEALKGGDLSHSIFGLGVVTGDNKTKLFSSQIPSSEPIYTGKEVEKYSLLEAKNFLVFDRTNLQQVAPDDIYRAPEKLIYKTINKHLKVSLDRSGALTSNSANIIIPRNCHLGIIEILALLNSDLYSFLHLKMFGGVNKVAKESLMSLPLPHVNLQTSKAICEMTEEAILGKSDRELQKYILTQVFKLTPSEISYIGKVLNSK